MLEFMQLPQTHNRTVRAHPTGDSLSLGDTDWTTSTWLEDHWVLSHMRDPLIIRVVGIDCSDGEDRMSTEPAMCMTPRVHSGYLPVGSGLWGGQQIRTECPHYKMVEESGVGGHAFSKSQRATSAHGRANSPVNVTQWVAFLPAFWCCGPPTHIVVSKVNIQRK